MGMKREMKERGVLTEEVAELRGYALPELAKGNLLVDGGGDGGDGRYARGRGGRGGGRGLARAGGFSGARIPAVGMNGHGG